MLRAARTILSRRINRLPLRRISLPSLRATTAAKAPFIANHSYRTMSKSAGELKLVDGKVSMSTYEPDALLDYGKYERTLKIVRDR